MWACAPLPLFVAAGPFSPRVQRGRAAGDPPVWAAPGLVGREGRAAGDPPAAALSLGGGVLLSILVPWAAPGLASSAGEGRVAGDPPAAASSFRGDVPATASSIREGRAAGSPPA